MNNKNIFNAVVLACASALLAACATTGPAPSQATVSPYRDSIELAGRLSVNYDKGGQPETLSGKFTWSQSPAAVDVALLSPLGQTIAKIRVTPESATLTQSDKTPRVARDIDSLTAQTLGWSLPVSGLRDWLQGVVTEQNGQKRIATPQDENTDIVSADGWRIRYAAWDMSAAPRPRRIDLARSTEEAGEVALRLVVDSYEPR